jgi:predicted acyltransferase (DUF342 family)
VHGAASVGGHACVCGNARVSGEASIGGFAFVTGHATVSGVAVVGGDAWLGAGEFSSGRIEAAMTSIDVENRPCSMQACVPYIG